MRRNQKTFTRLREDPHVAPALRQDLENLRGPMRFDAERGRRKFVAAMGAAAALTAGGVATSTAVGGSTTAGGSAVAGWLAKGALAKTVFAGAVTAAGVTAATVGWLVLREPVPANEADPQTKATMGFQKGETRDVAPPLVVPPAVSGAAERGLDVPRADTQRPVSREPNKRSERPGITSRRTPAAEANQRRLPPVVSPSDGAPIKGPLALEIAHLGELRDLARRDPKAAVQLADRGHRQFESGIFFQEREAIAILALHDSGERTKAKTRAQRFVAQFPQGPFSERIRALSVSAR